MSRFTDSICKIDDDFLINFSNKGILNRSLRELENEKPKIEFDENFLKSKFSDGTVVEFSGKIQNYTCTCPSRTVCKHVIMSLIEARDEIKQDEEIAIDSDFSYILDTTRSKLDTIFSKKIIDSAIFQIEMGLAYKISEDNLFLKIELLDDDIVVRFMSDDKIENAICSDCKTKHKKCIHMALATLLYIKENTDDFSDKFNLFVENKDMRRGINEDIIPLVRNFVSDVMFIGLSRLSHSYVEKFSQLAVLCRGAGLPNCERYARTISKDLELYFKKSINFFPDKFLKNMLGLYNICIKAEKAETIEEKRIAVGSFHSDYYIVSKMTLYGLGSYIELKNENSISVKNLFYWVEKDRILNYSTGHGKSDDALSLVLMTVPWKLYDNVLKMTRSKISLDNARINDAGTISSSKETVAKESSDNDFSNATNNLHIDDFEKIFEIDGIENEDEEHYCFLEISEVMPITFDKVLQEYNMIIRDKFGNELNINVPYHEQYEILISTLEGIRGKYTKDITIFSKIYFGETDLCVFPIVLYKDDEFFNMAFENGHIKTAENKFSSFSDFL